MCLPSAADGAAPAALEQRAETPLASLTEPEREAVLKVPAAKDPDKLRLFARWVTGSVGVCDVHYVTRGGDVCWIA